MMTIEEAGSLKRGDVVVHDLGVERTVLRADTAQVVVTPRLRGTGVKAKIATPHFAKSHTLPNGNDKAHTNGNGNGHASGHDELMFAAKMINSLKKDGSIPKLAPRVEAYFALLAAQF